MQCAASLDDPNDFAPTFPVNHQSKLLWLQFNDALPNYDGSLLHAPESLRDYRARRVFHVFYFRSGQPQRILCNI